MDSQKQAIRANRNNIKLNIQKICLTKNQETGQIKWKTPNEPKETMQVKRRRKASEQFQLFSSMSTFKDIAISENFDDLFILDEKIGEGAQSNVYKCREIKTQTIYAVKIAKKKDLQLMENMRQCYEVLKQLNHPNIIQGKYLFLNQKKLTCHLVQQYVEYSDLRKYIADEFADCKRKNIKCSISEEIIANIIKSLINCLAYMKDKKVCHRDLKAENIMYDPVTGDLKIIDFELAKMQRYKHEKLTMMSQCGSIYYRAPQTFKGGQYGLQVDMWGVGIIAFEMLAGEIPFRSSFKKATADMIINKEINFQEYNFSPEARIMLQKVLEKNPSKRISPNECLSSPFFLKNTSPNLKIKEKHKYRRANSFESISSQSGSEEQFKAKTPSRCYELGMTFSMADTLDQDLGVRFCGE